VHGVVPAELGGLELDPVDDMLSLETTTTTATTATWPMNRV